MKVPSEMEVEGVVPSLDELSSKDQVSWAQCLLEASYFDNCFDSPTGCFSPKLGELQAEAIPDLCPSPLLSDQLKLLHSWSSRTPLQGLHAEEAVSTTSVSCSGSEASDTLVGSSLTLESAGNVTETRKRKPTPSDEDDDSLTEEKKSMQKMKVKKPKRTKGPRYAIKTKSDVDIIDDGYKWRKYGQKPVKSSPHPRNYYRCTTANCPVRKRVERCTEDIGLVITSYEGTHSHPQVIQERNNKSSGASTNHDLKSLLDPLYRPGASDLFPPFPPVPNLSRLWGSALNFPGWPVQPTAPSAQDNVSLIMAYQLVKLQWELQARTQQFMDFSSQSAAFSDPETMNDFGSSEPVKQFPQKSESFMGSRLLRKRASAFRNGGPIPLDLQSIAKMQHLRTS